MRLFAGAMCCALLAALSAAAELNKQTVQAFERYTRATETRLEEKRASGPFLWTDESPERLRQVREGQIAIEPWSGKGDLEVSSGLIHDWIGAVFLPGVTLARTLASVQDYDHHKDAYKPEVIESRLLSRNGNEFNVYMRLRKKKVITVVLDTEHEVHYFQLDSTRWYSRSYSTKIAEVENPNQPDERQLPVGAGHGFLWRLYSYWRFQERDGGVYVECQALSLTRNVPLGLGWLIEPIIRQLPRESLANTLRATRDAALAKAAASR
ncbi:MAG: hypothetical protein ABSE56_01990 [Bryobacteraceae bacterium]|jgi:hypothetical protein